MVIPRYVRQYLTMAHNYNPHNPTWLKMGIILFFSYWPPRHFGQTYPINYIDVVMESFIFILQALDLIE